eukprot:TRINITY_DN1667_c0_g1_i2.p1 TRINITY_DN1667_c0_g1~~TRINITY_DN1667_c0_g1_i2.p1  ORF type:complete len:375 (-),score=85.04 TRINITY_DN1667_c0_g1_i2:110-1234(-)
MIEPRTLQSTRVFTQPYTPHTVTTPSPCASSAVMSVFVIDDSCSRINGQPSLASLRASVCGRCDAEHSEQNTSQSSMTIPSQCFSVAVGMPNSIAFFSPLHCKLSTLQDSHKDIDKEKDVDKDKGKDKSIATVSSFSCSLHRPLSPLYFVGNNFTRENYSPSYVLPNDYSPPFAIRAFSPCTYMSNGKMEHLIAIAFSDQRVLIYSVNGLHEPLGLNCGTKLISNVSNKLLKIFAPFWFQKGCNEKDKEKGKEKEKERKRERKKAADEGHSHHILGGIESCEGISKPTHKHSHGKKEREVETKKDAMKIPCKTKEAGTQTASEMALRSFCGSAQMMPRHDGSFLSLPNSLCPPHLPSLLPFQTFSVLFCGLEHK